MYAQASFRQADPAALAALISSRPFAAVVVNGADGPVAAHAPLLATWSDDGRLLALAGHVARANPFWRAAEGAVGLAVFSGEDAYVSPSYYPSKAVHGRVVPTWNYRRAEARGRIALVTDRSRLLTLLEALTAMMEAERPSPWRVSDAPPDYITTMLGAIVGFEMTVDSLAGSWKLSQNSETADRAGVRAGLAADGKAGIAALIPE